MQAGILLYRPSYGRTGTLLYRHFKLARFSICSIAGNLGRFHIDSITGRLRRLYVGNITEDWDAYIWAVLQGGWDASMDLGLEVDSNPSILEPLKTGWDNAI
jgi:hypothetical protein